LSCDAGNAIAKKMKASHESHEQDQPVSSNDIGSFGFKGATPLRPSVVTMERVIASVILLQKQLTSKIQLLNQIGPESSLGAYFIRAIDKHPKALIKKKMLALYKGAVDVLPITNMIASMEKDEMVLRKLVTLLADSSVADLVESRGKVHQLEKDNCELEAEGKSMQNENRRLKAKEAKTFGAIVRLPSSTDAYSADNMAGSERVPPLSEKDLMPECVIEDMITCRLTLQQNDNSAHFSGNTNRCNVGEDFVTAITKTAPFEAIVCRPDRPSEGLEKLQGKDFQLMILYERKDEKQPRSMGSRSPSLIRQPIPVSKLLGVRKVLKIRMVPPNQ